MTAKQLRAQAHREEIELIVQLTLESLGYSSGTISFNQAKKKWGGWFVQATEEHHIMPCRIEDGARCKRLYNIKDILEWRANETAEALYYYERFEKD